LAKFSSIGPHRHGSMSELDESTTCDFQIFLIHGTSNFCLFCPGPGANCCSQANKPNN
jgi:hypothetical protein